MAAVWCHALIALLCVQFVSAVWDAQQRNQILKIHNDYRKAVPGACGMKMMNYDRQLENEAKAWAKRCVFEHQRKSRGENIAWITRYGSESSLVTKMSLMWYNEVKDYTYGQSSCGAACHYTQLVWSDSTKLGCYAQQCSNLIKGGRNAYFLVCFYSPQGNYVGENPYKKTCGAGTNNNKSGGPKAGGPKAAAGGRNTGRRIPVPASNNNWQPYPARRTGNNNWQPYPVQNSNNNWQPAGYGSWSSDWDDSY